MVSMERAVPSCLSARLACVVAVLVVVLVVAVVVVVVVVVVQGVTVVPRVEAQFVFVRAGGCAAAAGGGSPSALRTVV